MFGEDKIIGHCEFKMDKKNRISIPSFTHGEIGDKIYAQTYKAKGGSYILKLLSIEEYNEEIIRLENIINNPNISFDDFEKAKKQLEILYYKIAASLVISKSKQITIPSQLMQRLNWENETYYKMDGLGNSLMISPKK